MIVITITGGLVSQVEAKAWLNLNDASLDDLLVDEIVNAASRSIEVYCGRQFTADTVATARTFYAYDLTRVYTDDFWDAATAVVKTDAGQDGTYETTLTVSTQYILEPVNGVVDGIAGYPYSRIRLMGGGTFATATYGRSQVQVTAKWGWAAVPFPVKQACRQLIGEMWKRKDAGPYGTMGSQEFGSMILSSDQMRPTAALLRSYCRSWSAVGALA